MDMEKKPKFENQPGAKDLEEVVRDFESAPQFRLEDLEVGKKLEVVTQNTNYIIERREDGFYISGNKKFCPKPTKAYINGSTMGGSSIKPGYVVEDGYLEYVLPDRGGPITTSRIEKFRELE